MANHDYARPSNIKNSRGKPIGPGKGPNRAAMSGRHSQGDRMAARRADKLLATREREENLSQRKALFAEMSAPGVQANSRQYEVAAAGLGVTREGFKFATDKIKRDQLIASGGVTKKTAPSKDAPTTEGGTQTSKDTPTTEGGTQTSKDTPTTEGGTQTSKDTPTTEGGTQTSKDTPKTEGAGAPANGETPAKPTPSNSQASPRKPVWAGRIDPPGSEIPTPRAIPVDEKTMEPIVPKLIEPINQNTAGMGIVQDAKGRRINNYTGMPYGVLPGDPEWNPNGPSAEVRNALKIEKAAAEKRRILKEQGKSGEMASSATRSQTTPRKAEHGELTVRRPLSPVELAITPQGQKTAPSMLTWPRPQNQASVPSQPAAPVANPQIRESGGNQTSSAERASKWRSRVG